MNAMDARTGQPVTLDTVIRHAAALSHPKSRASTYPDLAYSPRLQWLARQLVQADGAGESTSVLHEIAHELLDVMSAVRTRRQAFAQAVSTSQSMEHP